jgi:hypothetical protein
VLCLVAGTSFLVVGRQALGAKESWRPGYT